MLLFTQQLCVRGTTERTRTTKCLTWPKIVGKNSTPNVQLKWQNVWRSVKMCKNNSSLSSKPPRSMNTHPKPLILTYTPFCSVSSFIVCVCVWGLEKEGFVSLLGFLPQCQFSFGLVSCWWFNVPSLAWRCYYGLRFW